MKKYWGSADAAKVMQALLNIKILIFDTEALNTNHNPFRVLLVDRDPPVATAAAKAAAAAAEDKYAHLQDLVRREEALRVLCASKPLRYVFLVKTVNHWEFLTQKDTGKGTFEVDEIPYMARVLWKRAFLKLNINF